MKDTDMSDQEGPARGPSPAGGDDTSKVTRLPRRPRRTPDDSGERPRKPWRPEGAIYEPIPTRPVLRSELQRETGWWPVDPGRARHPAADADADRADPDGNVIDLGELRRKRGGVDASAAGIRRRARPRRIGTDEEPGSEGDQE